MGGGSAIQFRFEQDATASYVVLSGRRLPAGGIERVLQFHDDLFPGFRRVRNVFCVGFLEGEVAGLQSIVVAGDAVRCTKARTEIG